MLINILLILFLAFTRLGPVQTSNFSYAELNELIKYIKSAMFQSIKCGIFYQVQQKQYGTTGLAELYDWSLTPFQMSSLSTAELNT